MSAFTREQRRFYCQGLQITRAADNCTDGKYPFLLNVRSNVQGQIQARDGLVTVGAAIGSGINAVIEMQDPTPFASASPVVVLGAVNGNVYLGPLTGPFGSIDSGYSGDPVTWAPATPPQSPQPWLYVADRSRMRKVNVNGTVYPIGIAAPVNPPSSSLAVLNLTTIQDFSGPGVPWVSNGDAAPLIGLSVRSNTTIKNIYYDSGSIGNVSIEPDNMDGIAEGAFVTVNASNPTAEAVGVAQVTIKVADDTIAAIIYDSGSTGLCTIQPTASLGTGQIDAPSYQDYRARVTGGVEQLPNFGGPPIFGKTATPEPTPTPRPKIRQLDFPVNCLVSLGSSETVRIVSVAIGPDGVQSFRCSTAGTHHAGETIFGVTAFRTYLEHTHSAGETLQATGIRNQITAKAPVTPGEFGIGVGGVQTGAGWPGDDLSRINDRATSPDDDIHLAIRVDVLAMVTSVRVYFDVDASVNDFTQNYYFFEWRANDIILAIQAANANAVASLQSLREQTLLNLQLNSTIPWQTTESGPFGFSITKSGGGGTPSMSTSELALSQQLMLGNNQWLELRCKVRDLVHVGTDPSRNLGNVKAEEILVSMFGPSPVSGMTITVDYDSLWMSGGFGPDAGQLGTPITYWYRYRSTKTGARSGMSPPTRYGLIPRRQQVNVAATQSSDPQCDVIDFFRMGGALTKGTYAGTIPNTPNPVFHDIFSDDSLIAGDTITFDEFQPWPSEDLSHNGTCNVAGSAIRWVSGDQFDTNWAPGSQIVINGQSYTLYSQPPSTTLLHIQENAGVGSGIAFQIAAPTLLSQPQATWWGGSIGGVTVSFSCGDPRNPGFVKWTNPNNSEICSDANTIEVTDAAEPLQNGFFYDGVPFVASSAQVYVLESTSNPIAPFRPNITPCGKGFWTRWAFAVAPEGIYFLSDDGIYLTAGGGVAQSITEADLYPIFPHNGSAGSITGGYVPPDMTNTFNLRLSYSDGKLYFDYIDINSAAATLVYRVSDKSWWPDVYFNLPVTTRCQSIGSGEHTELVASSNGQLYTPQAGVFLDGPNQFVSRVKFITNQGDARGQKLYRDFMLDATQEGAVTVTLALTNDTTLLTPVNLAGISGRAEYFVNVFPPIGGFGTNLSALFEWIPITPVTILHAWDLAYQKAPELATSWLSGPTTHGLRAFQQAYMALIPYRATGACTFTVVIDGITYTYNLPTTGGQFVKTPLILQSHKGLSYQWGMQAVDPTTGFQLWESEMEIYMQSWGQAGGYTTVKPF